MGKLRPPFLVYGVPALEKRRGRAVQNGQSGAESGAQIRPTKQCPWIVISFAQRLASGTAKLVGTDEDKIVRYVTDLLENSDRYRSMNNAVNPYGDGYASQRIVERLYERCNIQ